MGLGTVGFFNPTHTDLIALFLFHKINKTKTKNLANYFYTISYNLKKKNWWVVFRVPSSGDKIVDFFEIFAKKNCFYRFSRPKTTFVIFSGFPGPLRTLSFYYFKRVVLCRLYTQNYVNA